VTKATGGNEAAGPRPTDLSKHSLVIAGHRTSISLERAFWEALQAIARQRQVSIAALVASLDADRGEANLSSAVRVFVLKEAARRGEATGPLTSGDRAT
jgi:predicted DNA-binding ribbon-helix-helix protein